MNNETHEAVAGYIQNLFAPEDVLLQRIRSESQALGMPQIHVRAEEGRMLQLFLRAIGAKKVIEIGTLAGYSGTWIARALPPDGRLISLDVNPEHARVALEFFRQGGLSERVEVRVGPALDSLTALPPEGPFDAIFIDANKDGYPGYLAWSVDHIRPGGLILAHNATFGGAVIGAAQREPVHVQGILDFNKALSTDPRLFGTIISMGDGLAAAIRL